MKRRLQNVRPKKVRQGPMPQRSKFYKEQLKSGSDPVPVEAATSILNQESQEVQSLTNTESLLKSVQEVLAHPMPTLPSMNVEERNLENLKKESAKKKPNLDAVQTYLDLLFDRRRRQIQASSIEERLLILDTDYQIMKLHPNLVCIDS